MTTLSHFDSIKHANMPATGWDDSTIELREEFTKLFDNMAFGSDIIPINKEKVDGEYLRKDVTVYLFLWSENNDSEEPLYFGTFVKFKKDDLEVDAYPIAYPMTINRLEVKKEALWYDVFYMENGLYLTKKGL